MTSTTEARSAKPMSYGDAADLLILQRELEIKEKQRQLGEVRQRIQERPTSSVFAEVLSYFEAGWRTSKDIAAIHDLRLVEPENSRFNGRRIVIDGNDLETYRLDQTTIHSVPLDRIPNVFRGAGNMGAINHLTDLSEAEKLVQNITKE